MGSGGVDVYFKYMQKNHWREIHPKHLQGSFLMVELKNIFFIFSFMSIVFIVQYEHVSLL